MKRLLLQSIMIAALVVASASAAFASPPDDGCARGFDLWNVATGPYLADNQVDEEGNQDGWVCARLLGPGVSRSVGVDIPVYLFSDNTLLQ
jgi:hypothetical protein